MIYTYNRMIYCIEDTMIRTEIPESNIPFFIPAPEAFNSANLDEDNVDSAVKCAMSGD